MLLPLLAAAAVTLPDPQSAEAMAWVGGTIAAMALSLKQLVGLYFMLFPRKSPPDYEVYATKLEMAKLELAHKEEMNRIEKRFSEWMAQGETQHRESMGKMEVAVNALERWQLTIEHVLGQLGTKADIALAAKGLTRKQ
jgi:hypothetical protein